VSCIDKTRRDARCENANRTRLAAVAFRNLNPTHRWCPVRAQSNTIQQRLQIGSEIDFVVGGRLAIDSHRTVFAGAAIRFEQPLKINQVSKTRESQLRRTFRQLGYPMLFR